MKYPLTLLVILSLVACVVGNGELQGPQEPLDPIARVMPQKTRHGYWVGGDPARFGGFIGDCASEEIFPHYW